MIYPKRLISNWAVWGQCYFAFLVVSASHTTDSINPSCTDRVDFLSMMTFTYTRPYVQTFTGGYIQVCIWQQVIIHTHIICMFIYTYAIPTADCVWLPRFLRCDRCHLNIFFGQSCSGIRLKSPCHRSLLHHTVSVIPVVMCMKRHHIELDNRRGSYRRGIKTWPRQQKPTRETNR